MLRPYQRELIDGARGAFRRGIKRVLLQAPTGAGKTHFTAEMLRSAVARGKRAWFCVHRRVLVNQVAKRFTSLELPFSYVAAGYDFDPSQPLLICSVETLRSRLYTLEHDPDIVVWDEAHHCASRTWSGLLSSIDALHIGITATPCRLDGRGLDGVFEELIVGPSVRSLIDGGHLSDYRLFAPSTVDMTGIRSVGGDWARGEAGKRANALTGDAIGHYSKMCPGARAIVFCVNVEHAMAVARDFSYSGIPARCITGNTPQKERDSAIEDFREGKIKALTNCDIFSEGFDVPSVQASILLRPTQSLNLYLQQVGRVLRPKGGERAIILDHAGNCERHGLPCDDRDWSLYGVSRGRSKEPVGSVKVCKKCFSAQPSGKRRCIYCGHEDPIKKHKLKQVDGELVEVERKAQRRSRAYAQGRAKTLDELVALGVERGYKNPYGWALRVYNGRKRG